MPPRKLNKQIKDSDSARGKGSARGKSRHQNQEESHEPQEPEIDMQEVLDEILTECTNRINAAVLQRQENLINLISSIDPGYTTKSNAKK